MEDCIDAKHVEIVSYSYELFVTRVLIWFRISIYWYSSIIQLVTETNKGTCSQNITLEHG